MSFLNNYKSWYNFTYDNFFGFSFHIQVDFIKASKVVNIFDETSLIKNLIGYNYIPKSRHID